MKTYHKIILTRYIGSSFFRGRSWLHANKSYHHGICSEFVFLATNTKRVLAPCQIELDIRLKNPKEKGFIRIKNHSWIPNEAVFACVGRGKSERFMLCSGDQDFLEAEMNSPETFWVRVKIIA